LRLRDIIKYSLFDCQAARLILPIFFVAQPGCIMSVNLTFFLNRTTRQFFILNQPVRQCATLVMALFCTIFIIKILLL